MTTPHDVLGEHLKRYEEKFISQGRLPRDKDWRPVRFAVRDVILAWVVARLQPKDNVIEVDVCLTYDPAAIPGRSGTKFAAIYILSQAYKAGSSMGIRFTENVEDGYIPSDIIDLAEEYNVLFKEEHVKTGVISPKEARQLYLSLTEFSPGANERVMELSLANKVSPERICYMVHHLTYTKEEMETLLLGTEFPENILLGKVTPEEYLLYEDVVLRSRDIVLGGMLDRALKLKEVVGEDGNVVDLEDNDRRISIGFDPRFFTKVYETQEETPVPWTTNRNWVIGADERMVVMVRGRDWADFVSYFIQDAMALRALKGVYADKPTHFLLLVPRNVLDLPEETLESYRRLLSRIEVTLMVCPESVALLDQEVRDRLRECETMRHDIGSGEERKTLVNVQNRFDFNTTEIRLIAVPKDLIIGRLSLSQLTGQAIYDEEELSRGVNKHNVRARYHLVCDRIQFLAHQALAANYPSTKIDQAAFTILNELWRKAAGKVKNMRLLPTFWMPEQMNQYASSVVALEAFEAFKQIFLFLKSAERNNQVVIAVQNKHAEQLPLESVEEVPLEELTKAFVGQFVPDWVNDYGKTPFNEVVVKQLWRAVKSASRGQPNGVNLSEVPHMVITTSLHEMVYEDPKKVDNKSVDVNIVYTDGSQARPFPLFCLNERSSEEMAALREMKPIRIGEISMRHSEMDSIIHQYWFRNIEVSQPGMTSAEVDELCYQITLRKLSDIYRLNRPVRLAYYQTGFQAPLVGFWRGVVEFLKAGQGKPPMLEIVPYFYRRPKDDDRSETRDRLEDYKPGDPWY